MRVILAVMLVIMLPACTSILLGDASTSERGMSTDNRSSAQVADDNAISATIRRKLSADSTVSRYTIGISTYERDVTLSGTVGSYPARDRAIQIATDTDGVRSVRNRLVVNTNF